ncbi:MAG: hypothetical protein HYV27_17775 [Candidatus Hydrogenedentes bacterium]|nr:hypothetical protein [Candidatus Hydrogenedentota bacterium]
MSTLKTYYVITMWSGGKAAKKWVADLEPELLPHGNGIAFINIQTKLQVRMIGSISIETYESGREAMEAIGNAGDDTPLEKPTAKPKPSGNDRLF